MARRSKCSSGSRRRRRTTVPEVRGDLKSCLIGNIVGAVIIRLVGAILLEQNDEWATTRRYMSLETLGTVSDTAPVSLPAMAT